MTVKFDDLEDFNAAGTTGMAKLPDDINTLSGGSIHIEDCPKCHGTGLYRGFSSHGRKCFKCHGTGKLQFKTSKAQREKSAKGQRDRKAKMQVSNIEKFETAHPEVAGWWNSDDFAFAAAMKEAVRKYGELTEGQWRAVERCIEAQAARAQRLADARAQAAERERTAPKVSIDPIITSLNRARNSGLARPSLRLYGKGKRFAFSLAPASGNNPGAIYVKSNFDAYLGKIMDGKFVASRDCSDEDKRALLDVCSDPKQAAVAYGKEFGVCSCCGRLLSDPISVANGIGPICATRFGF